MRRALPLLLLLGALMGLFGQGFAYAAAPPAPSQASESPAAAAPMSADCAQMMQKQQGDPAKRPCKGLTLDCIAGMGCLPPAFLEQAGPLLSAIDFNPVPAFYPVSIPLSGAELAPETHPPSTFG